MRAQVAARLRSSVLSKQPSYGDVLCPLIAQACIAVCPANAHNFDVDNVRVCKIAGGGVADSSLVRGVVIRSPCWLLSAAVAVHPAG